MRGSKARGVPSRASSAGEIGHAGQADRLGDRERALRGHGLGAVDQREPLLGAELERGEPDGGEGLGAGAARL
jgi:hypothetical protein